MIKLKDILKENFPNEAEEINSDLKLPKGKAVVLQADTDEHKRGLIVRWKNDGGYDVAYWYGTPDNIVSAELRAANTPSKDFRNHGKSFGHPKYVWLGYHPEIGKIDGD